MPKPLDLHFQRASEVPLPVRGIKVVDESEEDLNEEEVATLFLAIPSRHSLLVTFQDAARCAEVGLRLDARQKEYKEKYGQTIRVGIQGVQLHLWKDKV